MITQDIINRGGSKLEITRALIEAEIDIPIPKSTWKYYNQSLDSIKSDFEKMKKPVIVRGSHKNDYHGFIDIVPTHKDVYLFSELESAVKNIEKTIESEDVKIHSKDWEQPYTAEVHILVQEQSPSPIIGSMIRHPHDKKQLRIQYFNLNDRKMPVSDANIFEEGRFKHYSNAEVSDCCIRELIEMYEKLENSGIVDATWSQQVEFGLKPLLFYQARPFKKFQPAQDFEIPHISQIKYPCIVPFLEYNCFGISPKEGVELPFDVVFACFLLFNERYFLDDKIKEYGLILDGKLRSSIPPEKRLGRMKAFCSSCETHNYLFHNNYRLMKKAEFSFINYQIFNAMSLSNDFRESRLFCNGKYGIIIPTTYLK